MVLLHIYHMQNTSIFPHYKMCKYCKATEYLLMSDFLIKTVETEKFITTNCSPNFKAPVD